MKFLPVSLFIAALASAQTTVKLSGELAHTRWGAGDYQLSAGGEFCVFWGNHDDWVRASLYGIRTDGSEPAVLLTAALPAGAALYFSFALSADGSRVVFLERRPGAELALWSVPATSSEPLVQLASGLLSEYPRGMPLALTRDGSRVVYREDVLPLRLSSVATDGSATPIELFAGAAVTHFELSPDETHVVFATGGASSGLWQAPIDGSAAAVELHALPDEHEVTGLRFTPDQQRVVYLAGPLGGPHELWSQVFDGLGSPQRLNAPLVPGGSVAEFELTPERTRVVYLADQDVDGVQELFLAPAWDPTTPVKLAGVPADGDVLSFALLGDGRGVAFLADLASDEVVEAWLVSLTTGATPRRLNEPLTAGGDVLELVVAPDASHAFYRADARADERFELFSVPLGRARRPEPRAIRLNAALAPGAGVRWFFLDPARQRVLYGIDPVMTDPWWEAEYFSVAMDGGVSSPLDIPRPESSVPRATGNGLVLGLGRRERIYGASRLYVVPSDGSAPPRELSPEPAIGPLVGTGVESDVRVTADGTHALYRADQGEHDGHELFSVPTDGSAAPIALNSLLPVDHILAGFVTAYCLSSDGQRVAYVAGQRSVDRHELFVTAADGSGTPLLLHAFEGPGFVSDDLGYAPAGARVLYRAGASFQQQELFSVPDDAGAPPARLSGDLVAGGRVLPGFAATASGARVVYRADESEDERVELWSAPVDGSAARLRLHAPLAATRDVLEFKLAALGERVVFRGDLDTDEVVELYSVVASDSTPVRLNPALVAGGDVAHFALSPDGATVAYVADQAVDNRFELFRVPIDGSAPAVRLNGNLPSDGDVVTSHNTHELFFSPDGTRLVYVADALVNGRYELFSVLAAGGAPPVRLNPLLGAAGDVGGALASWTSVAITLDGTRVLFLANPSDAARRLYLAPIDGSTTAAVLLAPAPQASLDRLLLDDDGAHVYVVSRAFDGYRLLLVPLDGSFAPLDLSPAPTATLEPTLVPGADRVLQRRDPDGAEELFSTGP